MTTWWTGGGPDFGVSWTGENLLGALGRQWLEAQRRIVPCPERRPGDLRLTMVRRSGFQVPASATEPASGPFAGLIAAPHISFLTTPGGELYLDWGGAGVLHAQLGSSRATLYAEEHGRDLDYMVACVTGSALDHAGATRAAHASLIRWHNRTIMMCGASGSGKTTLALFLAAGGAEWLAEDFVYLNERAQVAPVNIRDYFHLRRGTWLALRGHLPGKLDALGAEVFGDGALGEAFRAGRADQIRVPLELAVPLLRDSSPLDIDLIILPRLREEATGVTVRRATREEAGQALDEAVDRRMIDWIGELCVPRAKVPTPVALPPIPCLSVTLGLDYAREPERSWSLLAEAMELAEDAHVH